MNNIRTLLLSSFAALAIVMLCGCAVPEKMKIQTNGEPGEMKNQELNLPGKVQKSEYFGCARYDFKLDGVDSIVVCPERPLPGKKWAWRARFWGHENQLDQALLKAGFYLVYTDVVDLYGSPEAVKRWDNFYRLLTGNNNFDPRPALFGMSRGGLIVYNWAAVNPDKVCAIYADAPVCDFESWPGGKGRGSGSAEDYKKCLKAYGLTGKQAEAYSRQPWQNIKAPAAAGVPVLHIAGGADEVVPLEENSLKLIENYRKAGGNARLINKVSCGHHPHCLKDPALIVDFFLAYAAGENTFIHRRGGLKNSQRVFEKEKQGRVAFLGGSITEMNGYSALVEKELQRIFPQCKFDFINAGIGSTCSDTGAFRMGKEVLHRGRVDLLFVEFAVNDNQDGNFDFDRSARAMEGIVRQAKKHNPLIDIVFLYTVNEAYLDAYNAGVRQKKAGRYHFEAEYDNNSFKVLLPLQSSAHEKVAEYYQLPSVCFAGEVARRMAHGEFSWRKFGGVHPAPFGAAIYGEMAGCLLRGAYAGKAGSRPAATHLPESRDKFSLENVKLISFDRVTGDGNWNISVPEWEKIPGQKRARFTGERVLHSEKAGAVLKFDFEGTGAGFFQTAGPDAGAVEVSVDGGEARKIELAVNDYSKGLHYPCSIQLCSGLEKGRHQVEIKLLPGKNGGTAARIFYFVQF